MDQDDEEIRQDESLEMISYEDLQDAYGAIRDSISQMDYDAIEMILGQMKEYRLPEDAAKKLNKLGKLLKTFDWDAMETLFE